MKINFILVENSGTMSTGFKTIRIPAEFKLKEKNSVFIGKAFYVASAESAEMILESLRKEFYDARHICYAYTVYNSNWKYSDDGEPNGTAGIRISNAVDHFGLKNILLAVVRYFGGVKLGVGPLGKTYYNAAFQTLESADIIEKYVYRRIRISFGFDQTSRIRQLLNQFGAKEIENLFEENPVIDCLLEIDRTERFIAKLKSDTRGKADLSVGDDIFIR